MDKQKFILLMLAGGLFPAAYSLPAAADGGPYVAADVGQSHYSGGVFDDPFLPRSWITSDKDTATAYRYTLGYQITPYWGMEVGFVDLGQGSVSYQSPPSGGTTSIGTYHVSANGSFVAGTATWPIDQQWSLYARAGLISSELDYHFLCNDGSCALFSNQTYTGSGATYGVGAKWNFLPHVSLRLGWDTYGNLGKSFQSYKVKLLTLGVEWHPF